MMKNRQVVGACSLDCPDGCSWVVTLDQTGRPVKLRGNPDHPFTRGSLCVKVNPYLEYAARPDRLMHPLRRVGAKGEGRFVAVTWEDALGEIASRLTSIIEQWGAEAIWPYAGTGTVGVIQGMVGSGQRLFHHLGASRNDPNICSVAGHVGMSYSTGSAAGMNPEDLAHSGLVVLWGTNTLTSNQHLWPFVKRARERGAEVVVVDPVRSRTAARADRHLAPLPGTDGALALGVMAHLVAEDAVDRRYLAERTVGWSDFRDGILGDWSVERAAAVCDLDAGQVQWLADRFADRRPVGIRTSMGVQRHAGGGQAARVLSCLPAVTGDYQRRGGGICYSTAPAYQLNFDALCRPDLQPAGPTRRLSMTRLGEGLLDLDDPPVMAIVISAANPVVSNPEQGRIRAGLGRHDLFVVAIDHVHTDTTAYADFLLPGTTQLEHADLHDSYSHLYLQWNEPAVEPPGDCLTHTEIFRRLAAAMGLSEPALFASDHELARAALDSDSPALAGITLESLRERGWARLAWPDPYLPFLDGFPTASGKFEFTSDRAEADGVGRLPHYTPPREAAHGDAAGLSLITPANHHLLNSTFGDSDRHRSAGDPTVVVHPADAARLGLDHGAKVQIGNERGHFAARLVVDDAVRRGVALATKGHWPGSPSGSSVNATVLETDADMGRGAIYNDNLVEITSLPPIEAP